MATEATTVTVPTAAAWAGTDKAVTALAGMIADLRADLGRLDARLLAVEGEPPPAPEPTPVPVPVARWRSGGNPNNNRQDTALDFGTWRGRPVDLALCYPTRDHGWGPMTSISGQPAAWTRPDIKLVVQVPLFPQGDYTYADAAAGRYTEQWKTFGRNWAAWVAAGHTKPVISLAWEANHNGPGMHYWGGPGGGPQRWQTPTQYIAAWNAVAEAILSVWPEAEPIWVMNGHDSPGMPGNDPWNIFPGRKNVRGLGVDYYDHYPPSPGGTMGVNKKDFWAEAEEVNGIMWFVRKARELELPFYLAEWAVTSNSPTNSGGDNPAFVRNIRTVIERALALGVDVDECYYDDTAQKMSIRSGQNPAAAAEYLRLWRPS